MSNKIVLIDGHSILNRAFYGVPDLTNSEGLHTNAIYGFLNILFKYISEENPTHLCVAFDVHAPTFRHKAFSEYKAQRKGMPDEAQRKAAELELALLKASENGRWPVLCDQSPCLHRMRHTMQHLRLYWE